MDKFENHQGRHLERRQRLHELLIALVQQQKDLGLLDAESLQIDRAMRENQFQDPASWLDHNQRLIKRYQALVRTAVTLDALLDAEQEQSP